ncbi:transposase, partial [Streptomyces flaveolus]|uniref:transposase n=1 Tax=Streptomyces flaveolus TaxID=67297 RepID=UPI003F55C71C
SNGSSRAHWPFVRSPRPTERDHQRTRSTFATDPNAIESVNARIRRAVKARGHFPNEQAALKCVYMAIMSLDPTGKGQARWTMRWKTALNAFDITFNGRLSAARQ